MRVISKFLPANVFLNLKQLKPPMGLCEHEMRLQMVTIVNLRLKMAQNEQSTNHSFDLE